jgi:hypothetical protein
MLLFLKARMLSFSSVEDVIIFHGVNVISFEVLDVIILSVEDVIIFHGALHGYYLFIKVSKCYHFWSVSRFQEKEKRGEMITKNDNIKS